MTEVRTIAVIGAGPVGRAIAQLAARGGYRTILEDLLPNALRRAESEIRTQLDRAVASGGVSADAAGAAFSRLEFAGTVEDAARPADFVIEAVPEELESKIEIFTLLDKICRPGTILASHLFFAQHHRDFPRHLSRQIAWACALRNPWIARKNWKSFAVWKPMTRPLTLPWKWAVAWGKKLS